MRWWRWEWQWPWHRRMAAAPPRTLSETTMMFGADADRTSADARREAERQRDALRRRLLHLEAEMLSRRHGRDR